MMNKFDINRNKLEIGDVVVLCDCDEARTREFEFWEVYADNESTSHSVFIRGLTTGKTDSFHCDCLKKVDKRYKELVEKATPKKPMHIKSIDEYRCKNCGFTVIHNWEKMKYCCNCGQKIDWSDRE